MFIITEVLFDFVTQTVTKSTYSKYSNLANKRKYRGGWWRMLRQWQLWSWSSYWMVKNATIMTVMKMN